MTGSQRIWQTCKAVERLVAIWEERRVFGASGAKPFKEIVATAPSPRKSHAAGAWQMQSSVVACCFTCIPTLTACCLLG